MGRIELDTKFNTDTMLSLSLITACAVAFDYCDLSKQHTLCNNAVAETCTNTLANDYPRNLTQDQKDDILEYHNKLRAKVASGGEASQPTASNMKKMEWDDELAEIAQGLANTCVLATIATPAATPRTKGSTWARTSLPT